MENLTGKQLGPYRIVAPLGEGGMAAVYKGYQPGVDRYVAIKILPQQLAKDPQFVGRFKQEAHLIANLQHPHILPVHDFGEVDGYTYIVMPFVEGGTLTEILKGNPLSLSQIRSIVSQIGDALDYAHSRGIIHRDVKPSNVLLDARGNCLLSDFGIAKMLEGPTVFTLTGGVMGTPAYMSPEQGMSTKIDGRSDIYALGVILYEMATGRVPFSAETPVAVVIKHINDPLPPPRAFNPGLPEVVERVILKALAKQPEDRFATAGDMVRAFQAAIPETQLPQSPAGLATADVAARPTREKISLQPAQPAPNIPALEKPRRIPRWVWGVSGFVLLASVIGLAALAGRPAGNGAPSLTAATPTGVVTVAPTEFIQPTDTASPSPVPSPTLFGGGAAQIAFASNRQKNFDLYIMTVDGLGQTPMSVTTADNFPPAWSPDGTRLVFTSNRDGDFEIYTMNADGSSQAPLTDNTTDDQFPAWSPQGDWIAFESNAGNNKDISILNITDALAAAVNLTSDSTFDERFPAWSADGSRIVFASNRTGTFELFVMDRAGAGPTQLTQTASNNLRPDWSPDGTRIVFVSDRDGQFEIYSMNANGSAPVRLTSNPAEDFRPVWSPDGKHIAFHSTRDGNYEIYVMNADGTQQTRLTNNSWIDVHPAWRP